MLDLLLGFVTDVNAYVALAAGWALLPQPKKVTDFYGWLAEKLEGFKK